MRWSVRTRVLSTLWVTAAILLIGLAGAAGAATITLGDSAVIDVGDTLQVRHGVAGYTAGVDLDITLTEYDIATSTWTFLVSVISGGPGGDDLQALGVTIIDECNFAFWPDVNCLDDAGTIATDGNVPVTAPAPGVFQAQEIFTFDAGGDGLLNAGDTSNRFFVSYGTPLLREIPGPYSTVNFMIDPAATGVGDQNVTHLIVPEPSTLLLLSLGIAGLARIGSRPRA